MILFFDPYGPASRAVLMVLHEFAIEFDGVIIDRSAGYAHLAPYIIDRNPQLETPSILDGDDLVIGTSKIEARISALTGRPAVLKNADPEIIAAATIPMSALSSALSPAPLKALTRLHQHRELSLLRVLQKRHPDLAKSYGDLRAKIRSSKITRLKKAKTEQALRDVDRSFGQFENQIRNREFVVGSNWTMADAIWAGVIASLLELGLSDFVDPTRRPATSAFFDRMSERRSFQNSIEPLPPLFTRGIGLFSAIVVSFLSPTTVTRARSSVLSDGAALSSADGLTSIRGA